MKKRKWSGLKEGIILYLAISKIFYWMNLIGEMAQRDFEGAWLLVIDRILTQDLPLILVVICLVIIDMSKANHYLKLAVGYVAYMFILLAYMVVVQWIFQGDPMRGLLVFRDSFIGATMQFVIISVILSLKEYFMKKVKETPEE
ncbi:MAG: hypothetical protein FWE28_00265 [Oscillospiraceae bacterium]|nr:hypothetical protein [Oscillospiraceae bacterium]